MAFQVPMSPAAKQRAERLKNTKGRKSPSKVPIRLARTSAFAPKTRGLITDSDFDRLYHVPGQSVVQVSGRELGTQHRDLLYALLRLTPKEVEIDDPKAPRGKSKQLEVHTTWRELIMAAEYSRPHLVNLERMRRHFKELMQVVITVFDTKPAHEMAVITAIKSGSPTLPSGVPISMQHILKDFIAEDANSLDSRVSVTFSKWLMDSIIARRLISLNAEVHFKLKSDYAKAFWPYIDGFDDHTWVDEEVLVGLAGWTDLFDAAQTAESRRDFRTFCKRAFNDMVAAGGLVKWHAEVRGTGRNKSRRYHYTTVYRGAQQIEMAL